MAVLICCVLRETRDLALAMHQAEVWRHAAPGSAARGQ